MTVAENAPPENFDEVMRQLQAVVEQLERGELPLEASLAAFERGVSLSRQGQDILDTAERKVEVLLNNGSTKPFPQADED